MQRISDSGKSHRFLWAAAILCVAGYVFVYATGRAHDPIRSDGYSYYVYLPSWFIYGDPTLRAVANDCCGGQFPEFTAIIRWPKTRRWVNAHPIGVAVMQTPFFLAAHGLTWWSNLSRDGFTLYYQHAVGIAGLVWIVAGLWVLRRVLLRRFSDGVTTATLAALLFGTNLFHYATYDSFYSHAYSFFLFAAFMDLTERWQAPPSLPGAATAWQAVWRDSVLIGLVAGLIVLTRHTNLLFLVIFPLYGVTSLVGLRHRAATLRARWRDVLVIAGVAAIVILPQLAIYYSATGRPLISAYGNLGFNFRAPHLWGVLMSVQKGLFFWSPLLLAAVAGFALARDRARDFLAGGAVFLLFNTYVIASWWDWQFGGSYGHRGFVDALPLMAVGLGAFFEWGAQHGARKAVVAALVSAAVALSVFQMLQYWNGVLPISDTTWSQYKALFLRL
jgi:hypothetical protein